MTVFVTTVVLFAFALGVHLVLWRVRLPKYHTRTLLLLFFSLLGGWLILTPLQPITLPQIAHVCLFYTSLAFCYIITYSALEADSPTLSLVRHMAQSGAAGLSTAEVESFLSTRPFVRARLGALVHDGLVEERNSRYFVASRGSLFFQVILGFRKLYGAIQQGG